MPSFARLAAALAYGALGFYLATLVVPIFAEERALPNLGLWNAFFGIIVGWRIAGSRAGQGFVGAIGYGLTTSIAFAALALFGHSFAEMIARSMRRQYDGPAEAVIGVMSLMLENAQRVATAEVLGTLLVGGLIAAFATEIAGKRYD